MSGMRNELNFLVNILWENDVCFNFAEHQEHNYQQGM